MEKLYLGVDLHKRSCWVTVLDADGHLLESRRIGTTKPELLEFFGKVRRPRSRRSGAQAGSHRLLPLAARAACAGRVATCRKSSGAHLGWRMVGTSTFNV
jgi:hypothetical protein